MLRPLHFGVLAFGAPTRAEDQRSSTVSIDEHVGRDLAPIAALVAARARTGRQLAAGR